MGRRWGRLLHNLNVRGLLVAVDIVELPFLNVTSWTAADSGLDVVGVCRYDALAAADGVEEVAGGQCLGTLHQLVFLVLRLGSCGDCWLVGEVVFGELSGFVELVVATCGHEDALSENFWGIV